MIVEGIAPEETVSAVGVGSVMGNGAVGIDAGNYEVGLTGVVGFRASGIQNSESVVKPRLRIEEVVRGDADRPRVDPRDAL